MKVEPEQVARTAKQLLLAGGALTIVLAPGLFLLQTPLATIELPDLTGVFIDIVLGIVLIIAAWQMKNPLTATLLAFVASIALLGLNGTAGLIGGLFGVVGAVAGATPIVWDFLTQKG